MTGKPVRDSIKGIAAVRAAGLRERALKHDVLCHVIGGTLLLEA
jgi:hypothetical protein